MHCVWFLFISELLEISLKSPCHYVFFNVFLFGMIGYTQIPLGGSYWWLEVYCWSTRRPLSRRPFSVGCNVVIRRWCGRCWSIKLMCISTSPENGAESHKGWWLKGADPVQILNFGLHPQKLTAGTWKSHVWKGKSSSKPPFLGFHVSFPGSICEYSKA